YPYLFLRAARAGRLLSAMPVYLKAHPGTYALPFSGLGFDDEWQMSRLFSTVPVRLRFTDDGVATEPVLHGGLRRGLIAEHDLVEEDATIFQYRALIGARGTGAGYRNWLRETRGYSHLFSILANRFGDDAALNMLPMLTRIAFHTTRPMHTCAQVLATIVGWHLDLDDADETTFYEPILMEHIEENIGVADEQSLSIAIPESQDAAGFITAEAFDALIARTPQLSVCPLATESRRGTEDTSTITEILRAPWETFKRGSADVPDQLYPFLPPVFMVRPDTPGFRHGWSV